MIAAALFLLMVGMVIYTAIRITGDSDDASHDLPAMAMKAATSTGSSGQTTTEADVLHWLRSFGLRPDRAVVVRWVGDHLEVESLFGGGPC